MRRVVVLVAVVAILAFLFIGRNLWRQPAIEKIESELEVSGGAPVESSLTERLVRLEEEKRQLPRRGTAPARHHKPVAIMQQGRGGVALSLPTMRDYSSPLFQLVDARESIIAPAKPGERRRICYEWLFAVGDEQIPIIVHEYYSEFADGRREYLATTEFAGDRVLAQVGSEHSLLVFRDAVENVGLELAEVLLTDRQGRSLVVVTSPEATLDTVREAREALEASGFCRFVEVDTVMRASKKPNDEMFSEQWWLPKIGAEEAWETTTGSEEVLVGVVDTGIAYDHPDLNKNLWRGENGEYGVNTFDGGFDTSDGRLMDKDGHGTHVSGIIGAVGDNKTGVCGVNWTTRIVTVNYTMSGGTHLGFASDSIAGFEYCKEKGCRVINFSSGALEGDWTIFEDSIATFNAGIDSLREGGVILVCAAGNESNDNDICANYPSNCPQDNVIAVAATTQEDELAYFSNYGLKSVDIAAPGYEILSTVMSRTYFWGEWTYKYYYTCYNGTSMASPVVTGTLALMMSHYPNENYRTLIDRLFASSDKIDGLASKIPNGRRVNVANVFNMPEAPTGVVASQGTSRYAVDISWQSAGEGMFYQVYYASEADSRPDAISEWLTDTSFHYVNPPLGEGFYYVRCCASENGSNSSLLSECAIGSVRETSSMMETTGCFLASRGVSRMRPLVSADGECAFVASTADGECLRLAFDGEETTVIAFSTLYGKHESTATDFSCLEIAANTDFTRFALLFKAISLKNDAGDEPGDNTRDDEPVEEEVNPGLLFVFVIERTGEIVWRALRDNLVPEEVGDWHFLFAGEDSSFIIYAPPLGVRHYAADGKTYRELPLENVVGRMAFAPQKRLLFFVQAQDEGDAFIHSYALDNEQLEATGLAPALPEGELQASSDGKMLLFKKSTEELCLASRTEEGWNTKSVPATDAVCLSLSANGAFASWQVSDESGVRICIYDTLTDCQQKLPTIYAQDALPTLAPDGLSLALIADASGTSQLWQTNELGNSCNLSLHQGWTLIGMPFALDDSSQQLLKAAGTLFAWQVDSFVPTDDLPAGTAGWLFSAEEKKLFVTGHLVYTELTQTIGWNLFAGWCNQEVIPQNAILYDTENNGYIRFSRQKCRLNGAVWSFNAFLE